MAESLTTEERFLFLQDFVLKALRVKKEQWEKCVAVDEQKQVIQDFLDKPDHTVLVMYLNAAGMLVPSNGFAGTSNHKAVYFMKTSRRALSSDTMRTDLPCGEMSCSPVHQLAVLLDKVRKKFCSAYAALQHTLFT